ncbi:hypothetical protein [Bacillus paranthracis]|uniref:hypothetical protein n=1 Tax=Bacillus paranthracis TaxID=2026186 RepID=UPI001D0D1C65|nr:hypothetical protein [Bacillus paranthracis]
MDTINTVEELKEAIKVKKVDGFSYSFCMDSLQVNRKVLLELLQVQNGSDFYLDEHNVTNRLVKEWEKYGSIVVAYDFDNTVYDYHKEGQTYVSVIQLLHECKESGAYLMVYTARKDNELEFVKEYLEQNNVPYDSINETPDFIPCKGGKKLYYNILLDDRAGLPSAYRSLKSAVQHMQKRQKESM